MEVRREVHGDEHVDARHGAHDRPHARLPGAHHPVRLGRDLDAAGPRPAHAQPASRSRRWWRSAASDELALHLRSARRIGVEWDEIKEVLLQSAVYCGVPAANSAFAIAQRVMDAEEG